MAKIPMTFGSVTVEANAPSKAEIKRNVRAGKAVISGLLERIQTPASKLHSRKISLTTALTRRSLIV